MKQILINSAFTIFFLLLINNGCSQKIISGPIQGETTDTSALFWVLIKHVENISIVDLNSMVKFHQIEIEEDTVVNKFYHNLRAYQYKIHYSKNESTSLHYAIMLNNNILESFSFSPILPKKSSFLFGSCAYIGKGFSKGYRPWNMTKIYKTMSHENADYMIWMGDNLYLTLNHDFKNIFSIYRRYLSVRKDKNLNLFLSSNIQHYATWDDHEFGPDNCDGSFINAPLTTAAFLNFWPNPKPAHEKGIYYTFKKGDIEFFMTDSRSFRKNNGTSLLGEMQLSWLKESLKKSTSVFKIIVISNQVINNVSGHESYYDFPVERASLFNYIINEKIPGVVFFTGDRHHSEVQKEDLNYPYPIYDITCSALSSPRPKFRGWGPEGKIKERLNGSFITRHNYGICTVSGIDNNKKLNIELKNNRQKTMFSFSVHMNELGY